MDHPTDSIPTCRVERDGVIYTINRRDLGADEVALDDAPATVDESGLPASFVSVDNGEVPIADSAPTADEVPAEGAADGAEG